MDVTFNENQSFFHSYHYLQEETPNEDSEFESLPPLPSTTSGPASSLSPSLSSPSTPSPPSPLSSPSSPSSPSSSLPSSSSFSPLENEPTRLQVYSRRMKLNPKPDQVPLSEPLSGNEITHPSSNEPELSDLDLPIALRKATRKCTQHPISQFVSDQRLSA
ncbi:Protein kinase domain-containing protein [Psidium guajava]|nr:Protein kinase domain-containing protein [Psidium guajava]